MPEKFDMNIVHKCIVCGRKATQESYNPFEKKIIYTCSFKCLMTYKNEISSSISNEK